MTPITGIPATRAYLSEKPVEMVTSDAEEKVTPEFLLFQASGKIAATPPRYTAEHKPTFEMSSAIVVSAAPHQTTTQGVRTGESRHIAPTGISHGGSSNISLASALAGTEHSSKGGNKKDQQGHTFRSAEFNLANVRIGALDDNTMSIMSIMNLC